MLFTSLPDSRTKVPTAPIARKTPDGGRVIRARSRCFLPVRRRSPKFVVVLLAAGFATAACGDFTQSTSPMADTASVAATLPPVSSPTKPTATDMTSAAPTTTMTSTRAAAAAPVPAAATEPAPATTPAEGNSPCSLVDRQPIDILRDQRQLHRLAISDTFDSVACYAVMDMLSRGDWKPSFDIDPALCPGRRPTFAVADTVQLVIDIAWVADVLAGPYELPVGVATSTRPNSAGGLRSLAVVVLCR